MHLRIRTIALVGVMSASSGALLRGFFPPFVLDDTFWRSFWSGPPAAGIFALVGAVIAYAAARVAAAMSRTGAERQEWWDRTEWALNLARSDSRADRLIGLRALTALKEDATETELQLVMAVIEAVAGTDGNVDNRPQREDNMCRRFAAWLRIRKVL